MKVRDIMTKEVKCCGPGANLAMASELLWTNDCGVLPVAEDGKLVAIITDRDICIALGTRNRTAAEITVGDVATRDVQTCVPDADIHAAMAIMRRARVRRLPVVNEGEIVGILSLNDIIEAASPKRGEIDYEEVVDTLKAISEPRTQKPAAAPSVAPTTFPPFPVAVA